jgi:hypothetical protein
MCFTSFSYTSGDRNWEGDADVGCALDRRDLWKQGSRKEDGKMNGENRRMMLFSNPLICTCLHYTGETCGSKEKKEDII